MGPSSREKHGAYALQLGDNMSGLESVPSAYLSIGFLTILGIIMPLTNFLITWVVRPRVDPARPHITRSYLLEGYERDHSLYPRRLTTFECGSEPVGDAMIQFHFQYYWYAIIFLVFDVAFMFLVLAAWLLLKPHRQMQRPEPLTKPSTPSWCSQSSSLRCL